jgi:hypothetical protein
VLALACSTVELAPARVAVVLITNIHHNRW